MRLFELGHANRRKAPRHVGSHCVIVFVGQDRVGEAQVLDQSQTGARLAWRLGRPAPSAGVIFDRRSYRVSSFRKVWQHGGFMGVRYTRSQDARGLLAPEFRFVKALLTGPSGARIVI